MTQIPVERIGPFQLAEIDIAQAIAVHVAQSHTGTAQANLVFCGFDVGKVIGERDSRERGRQPREPCFARPGNWKLGAPKTGGRLPFGRAGRSRQDKKRNRLDRKSTRLNSSHGYISYAVFCLKKKKKTTRT